VLAALGRLERGDRGLELAIAGFLHVGESSGSLRAEPPTRTLQVKGPTAELAAGPSASPVGVLAPTTW